MIVAVDSGVWISALQFDGTPLEAIEHIAVRHNFAICQTIVDEIRNGLKRKFGWTAKEFEDTFAFYCTHPVFVHVMGTVCGICRDPKDDMVIECALRAGAECLVTGDKDLLSLKKYQSIRILTPRAFLTENAL